MEKLIKVGDKEVKLKSNAGLLRRYREWFGRDLTLDANEISQALANCADEEGFTSFSNLPIDILTMFENIAYAMNKYADPSQPDDIDEWLDQFDTFDVYTIFPELVTLWTEDSKPQSKSKKKSEKQ